MPHRTLVQQVDLHAGLIVILPNVRRDEQIALFTQALTLANLLRCENSQTDSKAIVEIATPPGHTGSWEIPMQEGQADLKTRLDVSSPI